MTEEDRSRPQHIRRTDLTFEPWANGQGLTSTIAVDGAAPGERSRWRLSLAMLTETSTFSTFEHTDRVFTVVGEHGVDLTFGHERRRCEPGDPVSFRGESMPFCVIAHQTTALNVMTDRRRAVSSVDYSRASDKALRIDANSGHLVTAVFLMSGRAAVGDISMSPGDTILAGEGASAVVGSGQVILVTVDLPTPMTGGA